MVADAIQQLNEIKTDFNAVRLQFHETFEKIQMPKESNGKGWDLQNVLSCKSVRKEAIQIVGNFCASSIQAKTGQEGKIREDFAGLDVVRNGMGISIIFIAGGFMLCGGSLMKFLLGLIERHPGGYYQEIRTLDNNGSPESSVREGANRSNQVEWESELATI